MRTNVSRGWLLLGILFIVAAMAATTHVVVAARERSLHRTAPTFVEPEPFEARGWNSESATRRIAMARQLTASGELVGRTRESIVEFLGPPTPDSTDERMKWFLGERQSAASMMYPYREYLTVSFDDRGKCDDARIFNLD